MKKVTLRITVALGIILSMAAGVSAQDSMRKMLKKTFGDLTFEAKADTTFFQTDVRRQATGLNFFYRRVDLSLPLFQDERQEWSLGGKFGATELDTRARLPDTGGRLPNELWDLGLWTAYRRKIDNGWIAGGSLSFGSPSDKPFASRHEMETAANGFLRIPHGQSDAWVAMLNWSNNREFAPGIPLPGLAYEFNRGRDLQALVGLPFSSIRWRVDERWTLSASYLVPRTVHAKATYALTEKLKAFVAYDWQNRRWFRHDRRDHEDRLFYYEMNATSGVEWEISKQASLVVAAGYGFQRMLFEGDRNDNRINLADSPLVSLNLVLSF